MSDIFISYSHKDEAWKDRLLTHLEPLLEGSGFQAWEDRQIAAGDDWLQQIEKAMRRCRMALLLISADFIQSPFVKKKEVPELLQRREREGMRVIPILVKGCVWTDIGWLSPIQMRPRDGITLASLGDPGCDRADTALAAIALEIGKLLRTLPPASSVAVGDPLLDEYLRAVAAETGELRLVGLAQNLRISLKIDEAYVPLRVIPSFQEDLDDFGMPVRERPGGRPEETDTDVEELFACVARAQKRGSVILGMPGAGKTTAARRICWRLAVNNVCAKDLGLPEGTIPVFLPLRRLAPEDVAAGLEAFLRRAVERLIGSDKTASLRLIERPHLLWVFDGLDEVVDEATRAKISGMILDLLWTRKQDRFLATSRYSGYQKEVQLGDDFLACHVRPLDHAKVAGFVAKWYRAASLVLGQEAVDHNAESQSLLGILGQPEYQIGNLRGLRTNPLLLTILCVVHHQDRNLPGRRVELYKRCVRVLLEHWRREAREAQGAKGYVANDAESVLSVLAWWLHQQEKRTAATMDDAAAELKGTLDELSPDSGLPRTGREFLQRMRDDSGVLAPAGPGLIGFLHQTFQEYLAARYAAEERKSAELVARLGESWWRETILLALAQGSRPFCREFFEALAEAGNFSKHGELIDQCIEEAAFFVSEPLLNRLRLPETSKPDRIELLKRLKTRGSSAVAEACQKFADAKGELGQLAREILAQHGMGLDAKPKAGMARVMTDSRTGLSFVWIEPGRFEMGSDTDRDNEKPVRTVEITQGFWLSRYAATNEEYQRFLEANAKLQKPDYWDEQRFNGKRQPVVGVSWDDAKTYCKWAECRLPTEAEWEYACRAASTTDYCYGNDPSQLGDYAWFSENSHRSTHPVGQKKPNQWGLYDMHGNVWEWCQDWYGEYPKEPVTEPTKPKGGSNRVIRGGGWGNSAVHCRSACRIRFVPSSRNDYVGFRVVLARSSVQGPEQE